MRRSSEGGKGREQEEGCMHVREAQLDDSCVDAYVDMQVEQKRWASGHCTILSWMEYNIKRTIQVNRHEGEVKNIRMDTPRNSTDTQYPSHLQLHRLPPVALRPCPSLYPRYHLVHPHQPPPRSPPDPPQTRPSNALATTPSLPQTPHLPTCAFGPWQGCIWCFWQNTLIAG